MLSQKMNSASMSAVYLGLDSSDYNDSEGDATTAKSSIVLLSNVLKAPSCQSLIKNIMYLVTVVSSKCQKALSASPEPKGVRPKQLCPWANCSARHPGKSSVKNNTCFAKLENCC